MNTKQKPRLDRRNAIKHIDYDASSTPQSSSSSSSFEAAAQSSRPRTAAKSIDNLSPLSDDRTSFRIEGIDGEFDRICSYLGLSGPEDFVIPAAAWEARKSRSSFDSSPSPRFGNHQNNPVKFGVSLDQLSDDFVTQVRVSEELKHKHQNECSRLKKGFNPAKIEARVRKIDESFQLNVGRNRVTVRSCTDGGCGIKGARPPLLAPPPAMPSAVPDNVSSTWDLFRSFGPRDEGDLPLREELRVIEEDEEVVEPLVGKQDTERAWLRHTSSVVSESCSDTSNDDKQDMERARLRHTSSVVSESCSDISNDDKDEDSFNVTMEILYCISPNGKFNGGIQNWQKGDFLGSGSFGTVYEGFTDDGLFFAVKEVSLLDQGSQGKQSIYQLEQEISLLSQFEHENIVRYLGTDKDDSKLYIFLELVTKGSLANLYRKYNLRDSQVSAYTRQILNGLNYLHCRNVVHRDIKCANILVHASGSVKLADFGLAKATKLNDIKSSKGTAFWMAPEVVNRKNHGYGLAADIWSLGCTVLEMLTRKIPYSHLEGMQALFRIGKGEPPLIPSSLSSDAQDFIFQCLQVSPDDRPTAAKLLDHPFVKRPVSGLLAPPSPYHNGTKP